MVQPTTGRRVALITGAARGQGRAHAELLAANGHDVVLLDACKKVAPTSYPPASAEQLADAARACQAHGGQVVAVEVDLRDGAATRSAIDGAVDRLGRLDVIVSNAGVSYFRPFLELTDDDWDAMIGNNLTTAQRVLSAAVPHVVNGGRGGSIVLTASVAGVKVIPFESHYVASKHGLIGLMRTLAVELAPYGIRVNAIAPGGVATAMAEGSDLDAIFGDEQRAATFAASFNPLLPPHMATVEEVAQVVAFLCSDAARAITGHVVPIDFGVTVR
jgi:NAD(P)-dependent dehydrogenase (short-subunit alcohol dehydrogenase family)